MNAVKFAAQPLNFNHQWRAVVERSGETVDANMFFHQLQVLCHFDRKTTTMVRDAMKYLLREELCNGNVVHLFDIVKLSPVLRLKQAVCGTHEEVEAQLPMLTCKDVELCVDAHPVLAFQRSCRNYGLTE
jgi:hypothetical protein